MDKNGDIPASYVSLPEGKGWYGILGMIGLSKSKRTKHGHGDRPNPTRISVYTLAETNSSHLKMDGWNTIVSFLRWPWMAYFQGSC